MSVGNSKRLNLRLEENYKSRREVMRTLLKFLATSLAKMNSESIQERKAKMLISQAHEKLKAVMAEAEKPWTLGQLALQRIEELQLPLQDLPEGLKRQVETWLTTKGSLLHDRRMLVTREVVDVIRQLKYVQEQKLVASPFLSLLLRFVNTSERYFTQPKYVLAWLAINM